MVEAVETHTNFEGIGERGPYIFTFTGEDYFPFTPRAEELSIRNIARSLAMQPRYNGMMTRFYSVAEHSVLMSHQVDPAFAVEALLHDAIEHVIGDLLNPIKQKCFDYLALERANDKVMRERFGLPANMTDEVMDADRRIFATEVQQVLSDGAREQVLRHSRKLPTPYPIRIKGWRWQRAEREFLRRCKELGVPTH